MANWGSSGRRHGKHTGSDAPGLIDLLKLVANALTGKSHRGRQSRRSRSHGTSHRQESAARPREPRTVVWTVGMGRLAIVLAVAVVAIALGWRILADTIAYNIAATSPESAIRWAPKSQQALDFLAQRELIKTDGDLDFAKAMAERALINSPLDQQALFLLGAVEEKKGNSDKGLALVRESGERSWRNRGVQLWLFQRTAATENYKEAMEHADALFRVDPRFLPTIFPAVAAMTVEPAGLKAVANFLATDPPWRDWVMSSFAARLFNRDHLDALFAEVEKSARPLTLAERRAYLARLIKDQRYEFAHQVWQEWLPPAQRDGGVPYNGNFRFDADGLPFNWTLVSSLGVDAKIVPSDQAQTNALRVQFSGARVEFNDLGQVLLLQPGHYRLSGRVKSEALRTDRGLWWRVACIGEGKAALATTELVSGTRGWSNFQVDFQVPSQECNAQELRLELPARIASEREIEGQIWYENLRIAPIPGQSSAGRG